MGKGKHVLYHRKDNHDMIKKRIGIIGGSFNPAHAGHLHISHLAQRYCHCDKILWVITNQNPLKDNHHSASLSVRYQSCYDLTRYHDDIIINLQKNICYSPYTIDLIKKLDHHRHEYIWVGGSDLINELPQWKSWQKLLRIIAFCIFKRDNIVYKVPQVKITHHYTPLMLKKPLLTNYIHLFHTNINASSSRDIREKICI